MIVATLVGGSRDGETVTLSCGPDALEPLQCTAPQRPMVDFLRDPSEDPAPLLQTMVYIPRRDTYRGCTCTPCCPHGTVTYFVSGWGL